MAPAWANDEPRSGVVEPVVTTLIPRAVTGDITFIEYDFPKKYVTPYGIAIGNDGIIWITEMSSHTLARFDPATGQLKEYRIPSTVGAPEVDWNYDPRSGEPPPESVNIYTVGNPGAVTVAKDKTVWFVLQLGNAVARFDPGKEEFTEYPIPTPNAMPYALDVDDQGRVWFVEKNSGELGMIDAATKKSMSVSLGEGASPMGIAVDASGKVWISEVNGNYVGRYDPETGGLKKFPINSPGVQPGHLAFDKNRIAWICYLRSRQLGVLMADRGIHSVVDLPGYNSVPQSLAVAPDGKIWIVDSMTNQAGWFDPVTLHWRLFSLPSANAQPMSVAVDINGDAWITQSGRNANRIARIVASSWKDEKKTEAGKGTIASPQDEEENSAEQIALFALLIVAGLVALYLVSRVMRKKLGE